ncbi:MAG: hypothetical protein FWB96_06905 [Defluviitaleaceae bacterium]|nr:hypothetical protein [Defluviitaleaceae bacterium]MCL2262576.1 hypothetical protein [Defluviitaleaceae bacterium]
MKKQIKCFVLLFALFAILSACLLAALVLFSPITVRATTDAVVSSRFEILADDEKFELWGYFTYTGILYFCIYDMAYILRGTPAQFDIRAANSGLAYLRILRGETYTPTGTEFQPIPETRFASRADGGGLFGWEGNGFDFYPEQTLIIEIDGTVIEPATSIALRTIQDINNTYFHIWDLAALLGFDALTFNAHEYPADPALMGFHAVITTGTRPPAQLPVQFPWLADILVRLAGHWVDERHFNNTYIDESVVFPAEIVFSYHGANNPVMTTAAPIHEAFSGWVQSIYWWRLAFETAREDDRYWWHSMSAQTLENGLVKLTDNGISRPAWNSDIEHEGRREPLTRIPRLYSQSISFTFDPSEDPVNTITMYIGDTPHIMQRYNIFWDFVPPRYQVTAVDGGIELRYTFYPWTFGLVFPEMDFRIYRSNFDVSTLTQHGQIHYAAFPESGMELMRQLHGILPCCREIYRFTDTTAQAGNIYYYSVWHMYVPDWQGVYHHRNITPTGIIRVDTAEFLREPPQEEPAPQTTSHIFLLLIPLIITAAWFGYRKKTKNAH